MTRVVYTSTPQLPLQRLILPQRILRDLLRHRELIVAYTKREFQAVHRGTYLGLFWSVLSPLIMLALFTFVFGGIFGGKFNPKAHETPAEFALALFVGLGFFNVFAQSMGSAGGLVTGNAAYVKSLAFPLEILPLASVLNALLNLAIALAICFTAHIVMYGFLQWTVVWLAVHVFCIALLGLGISWFLSSLSVFIRDVPAIVGPVNMVLMFVSGCFFPLSVMSPRVRWLVELNPLAVIIDQARGALLYGQSPALGSLAYVLVFSVVFAIAGYAFFMKAKPAFADVIYMAADVVYDPAKPPADPEIAVRVRGVTKTYGIWSSPKARLAHPLMTMAAQVLPGSRFARSMDHRTRHMYRDFHALHGISLDIRKGESWGFIGVNGSGKSTLLKIISGNLRPSSGWVEVDGKVAILDYGAGFNGEFTGRENIYLKASIMGLTRRQIEERFDSIASFADIGDFIEQPVKTYSSGMSARLGFAIMAHVDADIMITDEALAVGDAFFVQKCMTHIRAFLKKGTFLFVSHSVGDVVSLCEKAVWLENGQMRAIGSAKEVTDAYQSSVALKHSRRYLGGDGAVAEQAPDELPGELPDSGEPVLRQPALARLTNSRPARVVRDPRLEYLNRSQWRNDIEVPAFDMDAEGYGVGGARIEDVSFTDEQNAQLTWIIGAEIVRLRIDVRAERDLHSPMVGFQVKDRLGQTLFADNTFLITRERPFDVKAGDIFQAEFEFQMPLLPVGDYVIRAATALGVEDENAMLHCLDNALLFRSATSGARHGLVGVPMLRIAVNLLADRPR